MTLAPSRLIQGGVTWPGEEEEDRLVPYGLAAICAVPDCPLPPEQGSHHIEPRSRTGGPRNWLIIDCVTVPNRCRLCTRHHRMVTGEVGGHKARIVWLRGAWWWTELASEPPAAPVVYDPFNRQFWTILGVLGGIDGNNPISM